MSEFDDRTGRIADPEIDDMASEIESRWDDPNGSQVLRSLYLDRLVEKRRMDMDRLYGALLEYIGLPEVQRQYPSLMHASDGSVASAARYTLQYMLMLAADGVERGVEHCMDECERCFSRLVYGEARLRE